MAWLAWLVPTALDMIGWGGLVQKISLVWNYRESQIEYMMENLYVSYSSSGKPPDSPHERSGKKKMTTLGMLMLKTVLLGIIHSYLVPYILDQMPRLLFFSLRR